MSDSGKLKIDKDGNLTVFVDGKPLIGVLSIVAKQSADEFYQGRAVVKVTMIVDVERGND